MLAPEPMRETNLFVLEPDLEVVTVTLARMEVFQLEEALPEGWAPAPEWTELAKRYSGLALRLSEMQKALDGSPVSVAKPDGDLRPSRDWCDIETRLASLEGPVASWQQRLKKAEQDSEKLKLGQAQVELLLPLDVPVEDLRRLEYQTVSLGIMPAENVPRVAEALFQIPFALIPVEIRKDRALVLAASSADNSAILDRALKSAFFEPITLPPEALGRPTEALSALKRKAQEIHGRLDELDRERRQLASRLLPEVNALWHKAAADQKLAEAVRRFPKHGEVYLISGWVPEREVEAVRTAAERAAGHPIALEVIKPDPNRQSIPTLVRTPRWLRPFERLVTTFGLPSYNELHPTLIATASFLIMYGVMFGDLGHGLLLMLTGLWLWRRRLDYGILVGAGGMSGILFGMLFGLAFGRPVYETAWLRPLEGVETMLKTAVAGGVVLLNIGFGLNLVNARRSGDWPRFLLGKNGLLGIALYWTLLASLFGVLSGGLSRGLLLLLVALCILLWLHEPLARFIWRLPGAPIGETLVTGFFELFEALTAYASNSLSFIRLGAFAVAHEGLSALLLAYSGGRWGWLLMLVGTVVIVGFEGLIVGIQALRLEYYEFFGKFFQGRGRPFVPLSLQAGGRYASVGIRA